MKIRPKFILKKILRVKPRVLGNLIYKSVRLLIYMPIPISKKIELSQRLGTFLWHNGQLVYQDIDLENYLIGLYYKYTHKQCSYELPKNKILQVISTGYEFGGHTRVLELFSQYNSFKSSEVLASRSLSPTSICFFKKNNVTVRLIANQKSVLEKIAELTIILSEFSTIILHIHPDDILVTIAAGLVKRYNPNTKILLYNHADHVFSYGFSVVDRVLEITNLGWSKRKLRRSEDISTFVGVPIGLNLISTKKEKIDPKIKIISSGSGYKYNSLKGEISFFDILDKILFEERVFVDVYGVTEKTSDRWTEYSMKYGKRLNLLGIVASPQYIDALRDADIYLDSYPLSGGTAFPQGLIACGVALGLKISIAGFTPADAVRYSCVDDFLNVIESYISDPCKVRLAFRQAVLNTLNAHSLDFVEARLLSAINSENIISPPFDAPDYADFDYFEKNYNMVNLSAFR